MTAGFCFVPCRFVAQEMPNAAAATARGEIPSRLLIWVVVSQSSGAVLEGFNIEAALSSRTTPKGQRFDLRFGRKRIVFTSRFSPLWKDTGMLSSRPGMNMGPPNHRNPPRTHTLDKTPKSPGPLRLLDSSNLSTWLLSDLRPRRRDNRLW